MIREILRVLVLTGIVLLMLFTGALVLAIAGLETGPNAFALALLLAVLPVPVYLAIVLYVDRFEPEPVGMIALTFLYGATIAAFVAIIVNSVGEAIVSEQLGTDVATIYGGSISAPIVEEAAKGLILFGIYTWRRREFNGVLDGIVYASLVGLGFAMTENVLYYGRGAAEEGVVGAVGTFVVRGIISPFAHPLFTAMFGIGLGIASMSRSRTVRVAAPLAGLGAAMLLHSLWNTSAGAGLFFGAYLLVMVPMLALLVVIVLIGLRRERAVIAKQLSGLLPPDEVRRLASLRERRRERRWAKERGGRDARRAVEELQEAATELAFHREQAERGVLKPDRRLAARESALVARIGTRRQQLLRLAA